MYDERCRGGRYGSSKVAGPAPSDRTCGGAVSHVGGLGVSSVNSMRFSLSMVHGSVLLVFKNLMYAGSTSGFGGTAPARNRLLTPTSPPHTSMKLSWPASVSVMLGPCGDPVFAFGLSTATA